MCTALLLKFKVYCNHRAYLCGFHYPNHRHIYSSLSHKDLAWPMPWNLFVNLIQGFSFARSLRGHNIKNLGWPPLGFFYKLIFFRNELYIREGRQNREELSHLLHKYPKQWELEEMGMVTWGGPTSEQVCCRVEFDSTIYICADYCIPPLKPIVTVQTKW